MNKKYLMKGMAALALLAGFSSCVKDVDGSSSGINEEQKAKENAELQLGFMIPDGQTWDMASQVTANVSVNLGLDQEYTIGIYDKNPLYDSSAKFFALETVKEGKALSTSFSLPNSLERVYVVTYDSKNRSVVNTVAVENGQISANIGGATAAATSRAAENASVYPDYVKTLNNYLNPAAPNNNTTVKNISVEEMKAYTAITDAIITGDTSQGNHTLSDKNSNPTEHFPGKGDGKHYRVAADTEITEVFNINGTQNVINDAVIYVEGILHLNGNTLNGPTLVVASGGKIILDGKTNMSNAGRIVVMEGGSLVTPEGKSADLFVNNGAACYNAGTINIKGELNVNGSDFYNRGMVTVDVLNNQSGGKITNFGKVLAKNNSGAANAHNCTIINGCYMHFTEDAGIGTLTLLDNSRLDVDGTAYIPGGVYYGQGTILYDKSEINAGSLYLNGSKFTGPTGTGTYAIVKTEKMSVNEGGDLDAAGNVYFDFDIMNGLYDHNWDRSYNATVDNGYTPLSIIKNKASIQWTSENSSTLIIPKGDCTGIGYNPGGGGGKIYGNPAVYTYAFEDQTLNTDYDMNDVVLKVSYVVDEEGTGENKGKVIYDKTQLKVQLVAAGATYEIKAKIGDTYLFEGQEIHLAMGQNKAVMINTGGTGGNTVSGVPPVECTVTVPTGWNGKFEELPVSIEVSTTNKTYAFPNNDIYPHVVMIPVDWAWPIERVNIKDAYPGTADAKTIKNTYKATYTNKETNELVKGEFTMEFKENSFAAWATSAAADRVGDRNGWYNYPLEGKTMTNSTSSAQ